LKMNVDSVTFSVTDVTHDNLSYDGTGDNGTSITVVLP
jgi:hypothetical protein